MPSQKILRVILMPIVLLDNPRGMECAHHQAEDWNDWWQSYRGVLYHYSWIAEKHKVDVLVRRLGIGQHRKQLEDGVKRSTKSTKLSKYDHLFG